MDHEQKEGTGVNIRRTALALLAALQLAGAARAEGMIQTDGEAQRRTPVAVYVAQDALEREDAQHLARLLGETFEQGAFEMIHEEDAGSLRALVMAGRAPQVAICSPAEAMPWAEEGLLAPLDGRVEGLSRMQEEVVEACVRGETLYMAPLAARHRRMAVNARLVHAAGLGALLDPYACPVWMPSQLNLLLEELQLAQIPSVDFWLADSAQQGDEAADVEAFLQALYGGELLPPQGEAWHGGATGLSSAVAWLEEMADCALVSLCDGRQEALGRFIAGETALFIGWTQADERRFGERLRENGVELYVMDYPSSTGVPVRSWELTGVSAFVGADARQTALSMEAAAFLAGDERALAVLGARGLWQDGAIWLRSLSSDSWGATLRARFARALRSVLEGEETAEGAVRSLESLLAVLP